MSILSYIKGAIIRAKVNKNNESKRQWLRSLGAVVGEGTRFIGEADLGSEPYLVEIGKDCLISADVHFFTHDGGVKVLNAVGYMGAGIRMDKMARIKIGNNCFLGHGSTIMGGVKVGNNVIVGAFSVVTKDVPSGVVVAGMPAKVICTIQEYYEKNRDRGVFYPTPTMSPKEKMAYLIANVPKV